VIGLLFHEFAVVVGLSILVSAIVSLTLVPMLASRLLPPHVENGEGEKSFIGRHFEAGFTRVRNGYARSLDHALAHRNVVLLVALATFALTVVLYVTIPKGFFPETWARSGSPPKHPKTPRPPRCWNCRTRSPPPSRPTRTCRT
jgi:HAE1 family hydrophobic/amphiphilic exporter-1